MVPRIWLNSPIGTFWKMARPFSLTIRTFSNISINSFLNHDFNLGARSFDLGPRKSYDENHNIDSGNRIRAL